MGRVYIVGVGMTPLGKFLDQTVKDLAQAAVRGACADAGCASSDIQAVFFGNSTQGHMEGQDMIRGEIALRPMGIQGVPVVNVENACATGSTAFNMALQAVRAGAADVALAVGAEKMFSLDRQRTFSLFDGGWDVETPAENMARVLALGDGVEIPPDSQSERPYSPFMDVYAAWARFHMRKFGTTPAHLAAVAAKNHQHSVHNPLAQFRNPYTVAEVLGAPPITYPLTLPMCAPISDGAAAAILCSEPARARFDRRRAVRVRASVLQSGSDRSPDDVARHVTCLAARRAYEQAGLGPADISVAEVHDATAMGEIMQVENLGFCDFGDGGPLAARGVTSLGGRLPVNPSGGLESKGHPIGATGLGQIFELVTQLRGAAGARQVQGARLAIAENGGGIVGIEESVCCITILGN